jgi:peptide deformylase
LALKIRKLGDPVLREKSHELSEFDADSRELITEMSDTLAAETGRVGLAAAQVGVLKRLFIYDLGHGSRCLVNPEIVSGAGEEAHDEGCLSIPGVYVAVPRYQQVRVKCLLPSGHAIQIEAEGFPARVLQHECDHLDGVLIIDRCDSEERKRALEEFQELEIRRAMPGT